MLHRPRALRTVQYVWCSERLLSCRTRSRKHKCLPLSRHAKQQTQHWRPRNFLCDIVWWTRSSSSMDDTVDSATQHRLVITKVFFFILLQLRRVWLVCGVYHLLLLLPTNHAPISLLLYKFNLSLRFILATSNSASSRVACGCLSWSWILYGLAVVLNREEARFLVL